MFQVRDYSVFLPSPNASRAFDKVRRLDYVVRFLMTALIVVCLWNIGVLVQLRLIDNQDLSNVRNISNDISTHLVWILSLATVITIGVREWISGDTTTISLLIPLSVLLGLVLVPAAMTEIQPTLQNQTLRVVMNACPPKSIVNGELSSIGRCVPREIADGDVLLATSNPALGDFKTVDPAAGGQNTIAFTMQGRGTYTVYFMFRYEDMAACQQQVIFPRAGTWPETQHTCMEYNGAAWLVMPQKTSADSPSGIHLIEVQVP